MNFNSYLDIILFIIEVLGCISFASSGAITAIRKRADLLGVWILTLIEIFGGGMLRDLIMNQTAPHIFWDPEYLILASISIAIATIWFMLAYFKKTAFIIEKHRHDMWIYLLDAIGIAVFCIYGVNAANNNLPEGITKAGTYVYVIALGVLSGVGGGMFRDVFIGEIPGVFKKHFYMTPCIIGCSIYTIMLRNNSYTIVSVIVGITVVVTLRTLATIFKWNLPQAKGYNEFITKNKNDL